MLSTPTVAFLAIDAVSADGNPFVIEVEIGTPYERDKDFWACPWAVRGIREGGRSSGNDPLQSLCLALRLVASMLEHFLEKGGKLMLEGEDFPLQAYFGERLMLRLDPPEASLA